MAGGCGAGVGACVGASCAGWLCAGARVLGLQVWASTSHVSERMEGSSMSRRERKVDELEAQPEHGTVQSYRNGCRCEPCTFASTESRTKRNSRARESQRKILDRLVCERVEIDGRLVHPLAPHGTWNGYQHYRCRCDECRAENRKRAFEHKQKQWAQRVLVDGRLIHPKAKHGTVSGRANYGCECQLCYPSGGATGRPGRL